MKTKKIVALLLCMVLALSMLAGCGSQNSDNAVTPANNAENSASGENTVPVPAGPTEEELSALKDITKPGAKAVAADKLKEGTYDIKVASGSDLFKILESKLVVVGSVMQLVLKVEGDAYSKMYAGDKTAAASAGGVSEGEVDADGNTTFRVVVKSLNEVLTCSAFNDAAGKWYDRTILADSDSLAASAFKPVETADDTPKDDPKKGDTPKEDPKPDDTPKDDPKPDDPPAVDPTPDDPPAVDPTPDDPPAVDPTPDDPPAVDPTPDDPPAVDPPVEEGLADGDYTVNVTFSGGTGKARILPTATLHVNGGKMTVTVTWSSSNYDYMKVGGTKYNNQNPGGNSVFTFPIPGLGQSFTVIGDTTAMSVPHEIEYTVRFDLP